MPPVFKNHVVWGIAVGLALVGVLVYGNAPDNDFIWDDPIVFGQQLPYFDSFSNIFMPPPGIPQFGQYYYRPLIVVSYMADETLAARFWPQNEREAARRIVYHTTPVVYHALVTMLVFFLGWRFARSGGCPRMTGIAAAAAGALLFAVHPIHVESVAWMAGRSDVVCALFFLGSMLAYARFRARKSLVFLVVSTLSAFLAMLSKETGVGLVFVIPLLDLLIEPEEKEVVLSRAERREKARRKAPAPRDLPLVWRLAPLALATVIYLVLRHQALAGMYTSVNPPPKGQVFDLFGALGWYVFKFFWPPPQSAFVVGVPGGGFLVLGLLLVVATVVWGWFSWKKKWPWRPELAAAGLFLAALAPSLAIVMFSISETQLAERYLYIPSAGLCLVVVFLLLRLGEAVLHNTSDMVRALPLLVVVLMALPAAGATRQRNDVWQSDLDFWTDTVEKAPDQGLPRLHLGIALSDTADSKDLMDRYRKTTGATQDDKTLAAQLNEKAIESYKEARLKYDDTEGRTKAHNNLGSLYIKLGRYSEAIPEFKAALDMDPDYPTPYYNWGLSLFSMAIRESDPQVKLRLRQEGIGLLQKAISLNPRYVKAHFQLGTEMLRLGQTEGFQHLQTVMQLAPASREAQDAQRLLDKIKRQAQPAPPSPGK